MDEPAARAVLVTGGAGYIGSHACKALRRAGYTPVSYDNLVQGHPSAVKWGPLERGDILDRSRLDEVILTYRPGSILHFAAFASVGESIGDPGKYYRNNVAGTLNLLEAARDHGIGRFVFSSTCATYGLPQSLPIREDMTQHPINPYGASKFMVERMLSDFGRAHPLRYIALRYFNAAGADPDNEIGEVHDPETHLIPLVLDAASARRADITIFGSDYVTADGTCVRDYVHVSDIADAHVKAIDRLGQGAASDAFNLGNGQGFSVLEIVEACRRVTNLDVPIKLGNRRPGDPPTLVSDTTKAREVLGWQPRHTKLDEIVRTAWAWHQIYAGRPASRAPRNAPHAVSTSQAP